MRTSVALLVAASLTASASARQASFHGLGFFDGGVRISIANGLSADGRYVAGYAGTSGFGAQAFRWTSESGLVGLGDLPGGSAESVGYGISPDGDAVVGGSSSTDGFQAFRWTAGPGMVGLGDLPGGTFRSEALDTSRDGCVVVGNSNSGNAYNGLAEAFRWTQDGGMVGLGFLPGGRRPASGANAVSDDGRAIVGDSSSREGGQAFLWTAEAGMVGLGDLPGGIFGSEAVGLSGDGTFIVGSSDGPNGMEAVLWDVHAGTILGLGDLPGGTYLSRANDVSDDGRVVVGSANDIREAFIWTPETGMRRVADVLRDLGIDIGAVGWRLQAASGVSADGRTIIGYGLNPDGRAEAWIAVIPAPGAGTVLVGSLGTAAARRRTRTPAVVRSGRTGLAI